jgi:heme/copper-type cytochrome/quinol oxidase subunit 2
MYLEEQLTRLINVFQDMTATDEVGWCIRSDFVVAVTDYGYIWIVEYTGEAGIEAGAPIPTLPANRAQEFTVTAPYLDDSFASQSVRVHQSSSERVGIFTKGWRKSQ